MLVKVSANRMINIHYNAHEHRIESPCKGCHRCRIPDPPGCCDIPDKESREGIKENAEPVEVLPVFQDMILNDEQRDEGCEQKSRKAVYRPADCKKNP